MLTALAISSRLSAHSSRSRLMGHASRASSQRTQANRRPFYGREREKEQLDRELKQKPCGILLLLGPRNCGTTAILQSLLQGKRHVVYLDCRAIDSRSPTAFMSGLLDRLLPMAPVHLQHKVKELLLAHSLDLGLVFDTLMEIFAAWEEEFQQKPTETYRPALVIDKADALMSWADTHPAELRTLLAFFVMITKQRCHVVMATSEFSYQAWLNKQISPGFWQPRVIGDFPESEARQCLFQLLGGISSSDDSSIDKDDKAWVAVYEVCGGNAGTLARLANELEFQRTPGRDWEKALKVLWQVELARVEWLSLGGKGYSAVHYAAAALKLLDSQQAGNSVRLRDMQELLGRFVEGAASKANATAAGAAVLERLVQADALIVRPPSDWARDIPDEAFDGLPLVTAPSTMDLYCIRLIRARLEEVLETYDSMQLSRQTQFRSAQARPTYEPLALVAKLQAAERRIEELEQAARGDAA